MTWQRIDNGQLPKDAVVSDIEVKPDDSKVILVATNKGLFRSTDGGKSWQMSYKGLPHDFVQEIAFAPSKPNRVYLTLFTTSREGQAWNGGVYRSDDAGETWEPCTGNLPQQDDPSPFRKSTYGEIVVDPQNENVVYVGKRSWCNPGVYKTNDGGRTWQWVTSQHVNMDYGWIDFWGCPTECLAISLVKPNRLVFGTSGHLFLTEDGGKTWQQRYCVQLPDGRFYGNGLEVTCVRDIVPDPVDKERVYFCYADIGLLISEDGGKTFRRSHKGMRAGGNCFTVAVDPKSPETIWAATGQWAWNEGYVCRSDDFGRTWKVVGEPNSGLPNGQIENIVLDLSSPVRKRRLLVTVNGHGFFESRDGGLSWRSINGDLPGEAVKRPISILLNPKNPNHIIVAAGAGKVTGVYENKNGSKNWRLLNTFPTGAIQCLTAEPIRNSNPPFPNLKVLYAGVSFNGVYKSTDGGKTWERILEFTFIRDIAVHPRNPQTIYVATIDYPSHDDCVGEGVLKSDDGGRTWRKVNKGLSHLQVYCLSINPHDPITLYAGTNGNSAFIGKDLGSVKSIKDASKHKKQ